MQQPSQFRRVIWVSVVLPACLLIVGPSDLLSIQWWQIRAASEVAGVLVAASVGVLLGVLLARDIWFLIPRHPPVWQVLLALFIALAAVGAAIALRESGLWQWTFAQGDALMTMWCLTIAIAAGLTERRRNVRVYLSARHYLFIHGAQDA